MNRISTLFGLLLVGALLWGSCSSTGRIRIPVAVPPQVILPDGLQKIGLVNRTLALENENKKILNVVEGVLTGEGAYEDRSGAVACLAGAQTQLTQDGLLEAMLLDSILLPGTGTGLQPLPLDWGVVDELCDQYGLDGLLVLEVFDTDQSGSSTTNAINQVRSIAETGSVRPVAPVTNPRVHVKMAWRLYDRQQRLILDETRMSDFFVANSRTTTGIYDLGEFAKRDAIQQTGYVAGRSYALRFLPGFVNVFRDYYRRKGDEMARATRRAEVNDFDGAAEIWQGLTNASKAKIAGRACFNMAVYHEIKGDLETAREWAQRAYTDYNERRGRDYARQLERRIQRGGGI